MPGRTVSRRKVMGLIGGGVALAPAIARAFTASARAPGDADSGIAAVSSSDAGPLLAPLRAGSKLRAWTIVSISPVEEGAITVALENDEGHRFHLEILARDPSPLAPPPPMQTARFAVYVRNGGDGWAPTIEDQGLAAMELGAIIKANEDAVDCAGLLTHAERFARHSASLLKTKAPARKRAKRA